MAVSTAGTLQGVGTLQRLLTFLAVVAICAVIYVGSTIGDEQADGLNTLVAVSEATAGGAGRLFTGRGRQPTALREEAAHKPSAPAPSGGARPPAPRPQEAKAEHAEHASAAGYFVAPTQRRDVLLQSCMDDAVAMEKKRPQAKQEALDPGSLPHLSHLLNPFDTDDPHFNFTIRSIAAAQAYARERGINVEVMGVLFADEDLTRTPIPAGFDVLPILDPNRTAGSYLKSQGLPFGNLEKPLRTPLVADVFLAGYERARARDIIWTNFDLIVSTDFYVRIWESLRRNSTDKQASGFSVLRLDVMIERKESPSLAGWSVADVFKVANVKGQGGHDCMVIPRRWFPCLQLQDMVFGVGGWGFAVISELMRLSQFDSAHGSRYRILKPGQDFPKQGITRHIGSQVANPKRWYSNPVPWLGPGRKNQLGYNMRLKAEVDLKLKIIDRPPSICTRGYMRGGDKGQEGLAKQCSARSANGGLTRCRKKRGAQQPLGFAVLPPTHVDGLKALVGQLTGLEAGSVHDEALPEDQFGQMATLFVHTMDLYVRKRAPHPLAELRDLPLDPKSMFHNGRDRGQTMWDGVLVLKDPSPRRSITEWAVARNGSAWLDALAASPASTAHLEAAQAVLRPLVKYYVDFYTYWARQAHFGPCLVQIVDPFHQDGDVAAKELVRMMEVIQHIKLGWSSRWCPQGGPPRVCCALQQSLGEGPGPAMPQALGKWLDEATGSVAADVERVWQEQVVKLGQEELKKSPLECCPGGTRARRSESEGRGQNGAPVQPGKNQGQGKA